PVAAALRLGRAAAGARGGPARRPFVIEHKPGAQARDPSLAPGLCRFSRRVLMTAPQRSPRVLIADDNPQGAELLEAYLGETDCDVQTAADGEETLRKVKSFQPDLLLLDIMMPKISGFEVCKRLRADPTTRNLPVLMITALDQPADVERAVEAGTNDFLTK